MQVLIIGGGLIGLLTARELALAGVQVQLVEKGDIGTESSWAGGGILSPLYPWRYPAAVNRLAKWGQQHYPQLAEQLIQESGGLDPEWTQSGLLVLDTDERENAITWASDYGMALELTVADQARALEPELGEVSGDSLWFPDIAQIRNPRLVKSAAKSCENHGVRFLTHTEVTQIRHQQGRVSGVETTRGNLSADTVVVASGAWSARFLTEFGVTADVHPVRGQMLMYKGPPGLVRHIVLSQGHYVIPRRDGRILVGSTLEEVGFDKSTTTHAYDELKNFAQGLLPCLKTLPIEKHWSGLRPSSPQGIPYICNIPGMAGLYLNSGHFRNGVILGPASARLMSDVVLQREPILDSAPYTLAREIPE